ncbi:MAG: alpha/beta hydrolase [Rhodobacteraceae bacterium]|nr:alpha/beta hydrolase [Paracoccaceae bacterium]
MQHFSASDGARLAYTDEGEGLPLLCLAGLTRPASDFDFVAPHLSGVRLIRMDYRGRGKSDWTGAETYTVPREGQDTLELLDHLGVDRAAILGTSRGGIIGMGLAATAGDRVIGLCMNDIGPVIERLGLDRIKDYVGRSPGAKTIREVAAILSNSMEGFAHVPEDRWLEDARRHFTETSDGVTINYDPALRESFLAAYNGPDADLWPFFEALAGKPVAVIRGANSDLLSADTVAEMQRRRPDLIAAEVPDRAHVPFLDEPEALAAIRSFLEACR